MNRRKNISVVLAVCVLIMALAGQVEADTHYVNPGESIQAAIDDPCTVDGDEIEVAPGTYNEAINFNGKAVRLYSSGGPEVTTIDANGAYHAVKCVNSEDANTILEGFTITGGNANGSDPNNAGGGMYNVSSSPTVTNCTFTGNSASAYGGGMYNSYNSSPTVTNCTFSGNSATNDGGGMYNFNYSSPTVTNCTFSYNSAGWGGGMHNLYDSSPTVTNCTFSGNSADWNGGGMRNNGGSNPTVTNCTFSGNTADYGGGMGNFNNSNPTVTNCILWGDTPDEIYNSSSSPIVTYSDVDGGYSGTGNINADPLFVDSGGGDLRLSSSASPCVDAGDNSVVTEPNDLAGNPRVVDGDLDASAIVDMGAYELQTKQIHNITQDAYYETIQVSIDDANNGDQIEVAAGTYYEAINFNGKAVRLYSSGGPEVTIIDANGIAGAYHVVQCASYEDANTILEGFTITGGNANGPDPADKRGGGMYCEYSSPTVTNCTFSGNEAVYGGGIYNYGSSPTVTNCTFSGNSANLGGGMYNDSSSPTVTNCTFSGNSASGYGGGMYNSGGSPTLTNCSFSQNTSASNGGGMWSGNCSSTIINCSFSGNICTGNGGGMFNEGGSLKVTNCTFSGNQAAGSGGGMRNYNSSPTVVNCTFNDNLATSGGGMINAGSSNPKVTNSIFIGNQATSSGGGVYNGACSATVTNCTFGGNIADASGGGMYNSDSSPTVTNCILWGDTPQEIYDGGSSDTTVNYSDVEGGYSGTGNINADPLFVDSGGGDLRLVSSASPCVDAGDNSFVSEPKDLAGNPRVVDGDLDASAIVDMGAYELQTKQIHNITQDIWYETIQLAIDDANDGDEIEVGAGTYNEAINFNGKAVRLYSSGGPEVTIIDANGAYHAVQCVSGEGADTILEGFTITGGNANGPDPNDMRGGGMYNYNYSSPTVTNCTFSYNSAYYGGGMYNDYYSSPTVTNCTFSGNSASGYGGGMYNSGGSPTLTNCSFSGNFAELGGGMLNEASSPTVTNCTFSGNSAIIFGGGMSNWVGSSPTVTNCILWGDMPDEIYHDFSSPIVTYSDVQDGTGQSWFGTGCIDADPCFVDSAAGNLRLGLGSPCIDAGDNSAVPFDVTGDLNGFPRFIDDLCTEDTGNGTAPVVDMGAYEFLPADIDGSGAVDLRDLCEFALHWAETGCGRCGGANMDCDGDVDANDLGVLTDWWLAGM